MPTVTRLLALAAVLGLAGPAAAQYPQWGFFDPWYRPSPSGFVNPFAPIYIPPPSRPPVIGYLPNGVPMINPWVRQQYVNPVTLYTQNVVASQVAFARQAAFQAQFGGFPGYGFGYSYGFGSEFTAFAGPPVAFGPGPLLLPYARRPIFVPVGPGPIAFRGPVYHPGGMTAFGAYVPSRGGFVNPLTGAIR